MVSFNSDKNCRSINHHDSDKHYFLKSHNYTMRIYVILQLFLKLIFSPKRPRPGNGRYDVGQFGANVSAKCHFIEVRLRVRPCRRTRQYIFQRLIIVIILIYNSTILLVTIRNMGIGLV